MLLGETVSQPVDFWEVSESPVATSRESAPAAATVAVDDAPRTSLLIEIVDVAGAALILLAALPVLVLLAIALQIDSPGRLFFVQQRVGRGGHRFPCIKFRTMCEDADAVLYAHLARDEAARAEWTARHKLANDPRITRLGALVRKASFDEFPQLINVLRREMSLVGPRPIVEAEIPRYGRFFRVYCSVRPGLTGLWQISGRNDTSYRRRVGIDRLYVRKRNLLLNLRIIAATVPAVLLARGSY